MLYPNGDQTVENEYFKRKGALKMGKKPQAIVTKVAVH